MAARKTTAQRREIYNRAMAWKEQRKVLRAEHECHACSAGVHDPGYGDDGVCRCRCCGRDMTDEGFPWLTNKYSSRRLRVVSGK